MMIYLLKKISPLFIAFVLVACGDGSSPTDNIGEKKPTTATTILIYGDSVSQGYGINVYGNYYQQISPGRTYAELLQQKLIIENFSEFAPIKIINASVGAEFTSDGLQRLPSILATVKPTHIIIAHGTNDAAAELPLSYISNNLVAMANLSKYYGAQPLIADVTFTAFGITYANEYSNMIMNAASISKSIYINLLKGIAGNPTYYLNDNIHFNELAHPIMMENVWDALIPALN